jgi:hypothetical protein
MMMIIMMMMRCDEIAARCGEMIFKKMQRSQGYVFFDGVLFADDGNRQQHHHFKYLNHGATETDRVGLW